MKVSFIIRMVAAAVAATLASLGYLAAVPGSVVLYSVSWLLLVPRGQLTRPIPRGEWWLVFVTVGGFLAVMLTLPFLHLHSSSAPSEQARFAVAVSLWVLWMWAIYRRWQREKGQADA
jgi:energy-coupling factor transporter transmembrane protein EcfT